MDDIPHEFLQQGGFVGPRFHGVFFFQNVYWRVVIPLVFGTCKLKPFDALATMPAQTKQYLISHGKKKREYVLLWADCIDYDLGFQTAAANPSQNAFLNEMIVSVDRELRSTISDLCQQRPNSNAMYSARNSVEKAFKGFLSFRDNLTSKRAKSQFAHDLDKLMKEIGRLYPTSELLTVQNQLGVFAPYQGRYTTATFSRVDLWTTYRIAQFAAAELTRAVTGRNQRAVVRQTIDRGDLGASERDSLDL